MGRVRRSLAVLLLALWLFPAVAGAQSDERRANALYNEAKALLASGDFDAAVQKLTHAWETFPHPLIMKKRAETQEKRQEYQAAIDDYRTYLDKLPRRKRTERRLVNERIVTLEQIIHKPVEVTVIATRPKVLVSVDGAESRATPFDLLLRPGDHSLLIDDPRFEAEERRIALKPGRAQVVNLSPRPRVGQVVIATDQESFMNTEVAVDGAAVPIAVASRTQRRLPPREVMVGRHNLTCKLPEIPTYYVEFEVTAAEQLLVTCAFETVRPPSVLSDPWGWVTAGAGIAATAAGIGLLVSWSLDVRLAEERNQDLITNKDLIGAVSLGVGVALGVASYFVFTRDQGGEGVTLLPTLSPLSQGGLIGGVGRF